ncbi:acyl carrier protein [Tissierella praeacuta DSM 18095]|uniref:Acyl carrier protein n=2 Tax=Tissierella praeacuta TaxID=43131 RepID=A0A1M4SP22_9FIRM|nr:acyl carrier protein [Tissierella praeacuta]MBU5254722.1 acyl carrier protein [Tissierella praeacuta]TCU70622.1 acyl carrier protein [Tissierella praeacuta]SHE33993.1 acyl carrier protein [Tissierella praeacuta DSM 18095]SUP01619.1 Acyl carrier protein [Tissierella praeacuta]
MMIYKKIKTIIATQFNIDEDEITKDTSFKDTLNADSLDLVELIMALEDEFGLEMEDEDMDSIKTVGDAVEYITNALEE